MSDFDLDRVEQLLTVEEQLRLMPKLKAIRDNVMAELEEIAAGLEPQPEVTEVEEEPSEEIPPPPPEPEPNETNGNLRRA